MADKLDFNEAVLINQIKTAEDVIKQSQEQVAKAQSQIQQQLGVLALAKHLLQNYKFSGVVSESKES